MTNGHIDGRAAAVLFRADTLRRLSEKLADANLEAQAFEEADRRAFENYWRNYMRAFEIEIGGTSDPRPLLNRCLI